MVQLAARLILIQKVPRSSRGGASRLGEVVELVYGTALEMRRTERYRGFESHPLRHNKKCQGKKTWHFFYFRA